MRLNFGTVTVHVEPWPELHTSLTESHIYNRQVGKAYIATQVYTLVIGQAFGTAAMLAACGKKGHRFALEHARLMTAPPRMNRTFGSTSNIMVKANELEYNTQMYVKFLSKFTGRPLEDVRIDIGRNRYFTPQQAIEYGLIDK